MHGTLLLLAAIGILTADDQQAPPGESMDARTTRRMREINIAIRIEPPNALTAGDLFIDGVAVQALRMKNPLQLVSPFAPPEYGSGKDNVVWDAASGKGSGLKIFSIKL